MAQAQDKSHLNPAMLGLNPDEHFMVAKAAAEFVGLSDRTLARMRIAGNGPRYSRAGKKCRYSRASLLNWLAAREFGSTSEEDTRVA